MSNVTAKEIRENDESRKQKMDLSKNYLVKQEIGRVVKQRTGRQRKYTPTRMRNAINQYLQWCEEQDRVPSLKGLMIHLKMHKSQFYTYCEYPEFTDIMEQARLVIAEWCENDVYRTPGAASGKIAYMKNIHGWTEKVEQEVTRVVSVDEAKARLEMLLPKLMEAIKQKSIEQKLNTDSVIVVAEEVEKEEVSCAL